MNTSTLYDPNATHEPDRHHGPTLRVRRNKDGTYSGLLHPTATKFFETIARQVASIKNSGLEVKTEKRRHCRANCERATSYAIEAWMPWCPECGSRLIEFETVTEISGGR